MVTASLHTWEDTLRSRADEAKPGASPALALPRDLTVLTRAYAACDAITAAHSHTFHLASGLLPPEKRRGIRALYAFCRRADDIVDGGAPDAAEALAAWQRRTAMPVPPLDDPVAVAWADTRARYRIPQRYAEQLIEGVARDLVCRRYATFEDLAAYAYGVASTVGLMSMHIIGYTSEEAIPYAIKLGVALQLTNILRDVGEDWALGRVYLPFEECVAYRLTQTDLAAGQVDDRWRAFMRFQIARTRRLYAEAWPGIGLLHKDGRFAIAAAADLYRAILDDIERHDYDVFARRAHVSAVRKLRRLPSLWLRVR
jgi:15-cis-phytoene synthase